MKRKQDTAMAKMIYARMDELGIKTFKQLSKRSGVTQVTIWKLTKGRSVRLKTLKSISSALDISDSCMLTLM